MSGRRGKPILCLDFDGVIHSYTSGWEGVMEANDPPVPGTRNFLMAATAVFEVHIYSSRSGQPGGIDTMRRYIAELMAPGGGEMSEEEGQVLHSIHWPTDKPPAFLTIDDRAIQFTGEWPDITELLGFRPWNKRGG